MSNRINLGNDASIVAHNRCCECEYEWQDAPMGHARYMQCPRCGSKYWEWINYGRPDSRAP
jgi:ssDNA-binding Zn-finger/Zn-ribbon topoisomerase 1